MPNTEKYVLIEKTPKQQTKSKQRTKQHQKNQKKTRELRGNTWLESSERGQIRSWRLKKSGSVAAAIIKVGLLMELILSVVQVPCVYSNMALCCNCGSWA